MTTQHASQTVGSRDQESLVAGQFGPQAAAYVASAVHAQGEDLRQLADLVAGKGYKTALDLGCGGGHVAFTVAPHVGQVAACDLSPDMLDAVAVEAGRRGLANIETRVGRADAVPAPEAHFCAVFSRYSAHHWPDLGAGLREARRVVKPRGIAVFMDVVTPGQPLLDTFLQSIELLRDPSHVRNYSVAEWRAALADARFEVGRVTQRRLRLEFASWIARMSPPDSHVAAIRSLQDRMADMVRSHFAIEADGTFTLDTATFEAVPV
ncbi:MULTISPECIES: class I SAM-dependent methyltransferase [Nitrospirillum]|uniref:Methyltransferase family protein n=1 Tax=Nitrospirillum amazonense TaxID=28077 RepID=A0A560FZH1_9PROT|nr:class I SAM-dependent methyltransferase [Nitrospirillum amazonense]MEC4591167.1 class I SAM-dependent methyltransferase [Nitrospirillum amazonense]TWB27024.1 methyltransferase family protein [Nitrospirillum amazonense]